MKKQAQKEAMIPAKEHADALAKKDKLLAELREKMDHVQKSSLAMASEYKERFDAQAAVVAQKKAALEQALDAADAMRKQFEERIAKINERHGATVKQLREAAESAQAQLAAHMENAVEPVEEVLMEQVPEAAAVVESSPEMQEGQDV